MKVESFGFRFRLLAPVQQRVNISVSESFEVNKGGSSLLFIDIVLHYYIDICCEHWTVKEIDNAKY